MTKEEIIEMAHKSGLHIATDVNWMPIIGLEYLEKFAKLVAQHERDACSIRASVALLGTLKDTADRVLRAIRRGDL